MKSHNTKIIIVYIIVTLNVNQRKNMSYLVYIDYVIILIYDVIVHNPKNIYNFDYRTVGQ